MGKTGFFKDDNGSPSLMRLQSFMAFFVAAYVTWKIPVPDIYVLCAWLVAAFAPKVIQKIVEKWADIKVTGIAASPPETKTSAVEWPDPPARKRDAGANQVSEASPTGDVTEVR